MNDNQKTKKQLIDELNELRNKLALNPDTITYNNSNEFFELVFHNIKQSIFIAIDNKIKFVNNRLIEYSGYSKEELIDHNIFEFIHNEDIDPLDKIYSFSNELVLNKNIIKRFWLKDRRFIWAELKPADLFYNGNKAIIYTINDISDRKLFEDRLKTAKNELDRVISSIPDCIWSIEIDANAKVIRRYYSKAIERITGRTVGFFTENLNNFWSIVYPDDKQILDAMFKMIFNGKIDKGDVEYRIIRTDNSIRWVYDTSVVSKLNNGHFLINGLITDITRRRQIEDELIISNEKYKALIDNSLIGIAVSRGFDVSFTNKAFLDIWGYDSLEDFISKPFSEHFLPDSFKSYEKIINNSSFAQNLSFEFKIIRKDKAERDIELVVTEFIVRNEKYFQTTVVDVTYKKTVEQNLRESEVKFRNLYEKTPVMLHSIDIKGNIISVSNKWLDTLGYDKEEVIGKKFTDFLTSKSKKYANEIVIPDFINNGISNEIHYEFVKKNTEIIDVLYSEIAEKDTNNNYIRSLSVMIDITERLRTERIQSVMYEIANAVNITDNLNDLLRLIKQRLSEILDTTNFFVALYEKNSNTLNFPFFIDENDKVNSFAAEKTLTYHVIKNELPLLITKEEIYALEKKGEIRIVGSPALQWMGAPLKVSNEIFGAIVLQSYTNPKMFSDEDLEILKFVSGQIALAIFRKRSEEETSRLIDELHISNKAIEKDANELMELNQMLHESEEKFKQLNETKDKFFSIISHDLKNPFSILLTLSKYLLDHFQEMSKDEAINIVDDINNSVKRSYDLLKNLLDWSRTQTGKLKYNPSEINLAEIVNSNKYLLKINADSKKINIVSCIDNNIFVHADYFMLETIFRNLMSNAIKFTPIGGTIIIDAIACFNKVEISIKDNGIGISEDDINKLFRIDISHTTLGTNEEKGTGLGLILCREFVEKHGGRIWVESTIGKGSNFKFTLPKL